jgi:hypothetical protein
MNDILKLFRNWDKGKSKIKVFVISLNSLLYAIENWLRFYEQIKILSKEKISEVSILGVNK